jgi:GTP cyclohydrolase I
MGPGFSPSDIVPMTRLIAQRLSADVAHLEAKFTYFIAKKAPVTGQIGLIDYAAGFRCAASADGSMTDLVMSVMAPATSLCPCSKEISQYGAHNQRCHIEAQVRCDPTKPTLWIEDLVEILEGAASAPVYSVLKRPDEKFVTEQAYDNPKFVEDIIRDLALGLNREERVTWYSISSENFESIHNHNAFARITRDKRQAQ